MRLRISQLTQFFILAPFTLGAALSCYATPWQGMASQKFLTQSEKAQGTIDVNKQIKITEHLGAQLELENFRFRDEGGQEVALSKFFKSGKPVILSLVYYECPMLCGLVMNGLLDGTKALEWSVGKEFEIVHISIDPKETAQLASKKKANMLRSYGRSGAEVGWHFLTGEEPMIRKVADAIGFGYQYDPAVKEYAHAAVIALLTPKGIVSRYLYGVDFSAKTLKLGLLEASGGKIGTVIDRVLFYCYRYDHNSRGYALYAVRLMQAGGAGTLVVFGGFIVAFWRRQRRERNRV